MESVYLPGWSNANCTSCLACSGGGGGDVIVIVSCYVVDSCYVVVMEWLNLEVWQRSQGRAP